MNSEDRKEILDASARSFVSVIVPVYNNPDGLRLCLRALEEQIYQKASYEVLVVDNGSSEPVSELVGEFRQARLLLEPVPGSYAARNRGLSVARGEVIAFTDSDCVPAPDWLASGVAHLARLPDCGLLAGKIELFFHDPRRPTAVELYENLIAFQQKAYVRVQNYGATANVFTLRRVIDRVGPFNAALKSGGDVEWGQRVAAAGYRMVYGDDTRVGHPARRSLRELHDKVARTLGGQFALDRRGGSRWQFLCTWARKLLGFRQFASAWRDGRLVGLGQRSRVCLVLALVRLICFWEGIRLQLGACPRR